MCTVEIVKEKVLKKHHPKIPKVSGRVKNIFFLNIFFLLWNLKESLKTLSYKEKLYLLVI